MAATGILKKAVHYAGKSLAFLASILYNGALALRNFLFVDVRKVLSNYIDHDGELSTCAIAFFVLISFIPASLIIISVLSFFFKSDQMAAFYIFFTQVKGQLPKIKNINEFVQVIDRIIFSKRYLAFVWIPFLFWWGSLVFDILERALEKAFKIDESRVYWQAKIRHFIMLVGLGFFVLFLTVLSNIAAIIKNTYIPNFAAQNLESLPHLNKIIASLGGISFTVTLLTSLGINTLLIYLIYRFVPPRKLDNPSLLKGAVFAAFSYEIVKSVFSYYITNINDYTSIFGSLSSIVILIIWIWYTCFIFVIGAEMAWVFHEKRKFVDQFDFSDEV